MNKKLKLALATLLGFSAACSTVKNAPAKGEGEQQQEAGAPEVRDSVAVAFPFSVFTSKTKNR